MLLAMGSVRWLGARRAGVVVGAVAAVAVVSEVWLHLPMAGSPHALFRLAWP